jgi:tetratricopeptide (TPR) repeat protein
MINAAQTILTTEQEAKIDDLESKFEGDQVDWSKIKSSELNEFLQYKDLKNKSSDLINLSLAKYYLTNGNIARSKLFLGRIRDRKNLQRIKARYLALIAFIENDHQKSLDYLSDDSFYQDPYYSEVCMLKFIDQLVLKKTEDINRDYAICEKKLLPFARLNLSWTNNMFHLANQKMEQVNRESNKNFKEINSDPESLRIWLKTQLYLNKEINFLGIFQDIPYEVYQSPRTRELMALYFYRAGKKDMAFKFLEDLSTVNAQNIKGNILLQKKEYELALGHFKLALKDKKNSPNALERAIPLSYMVGLWDDGITLLKRHLQSKAKEKDFLSLKTAFLLRGDTPEKNLEAIKNLKVLKYIYKDSMPNILNSMMGIATLMAGDGQFGALYIEQACAEEDGIFCWLDGQQMRLNQMSKTLLRTDEVVSAKQMMEFKNLKEVKESTEAASTIEENVFIDQQDIEELDSSEAQLYPEMLTR